jgi:histidine triad (HIT) family protein
MKEDCIFCKLTNGVIPCTPRFENNSAILIEDRSPIAPTHGLVIPREHYDNIGDLSNPLDSMFILSDAFQLISDYVCQEGIDTDGYRVIINTGDDAGQTVKHLHFHVVGGAKLKNDFGA